MFGKFVDELSRRQVLKYLFAVIIVGILISKLFPTSNYSLLHFTNYSTIFGNKINECDEKNLILTTAVEMPFPDIYRFIRSARSTCKYCHITVFTDDVNNTDYKELTLLYNVLFLSYDEYTPKQMPSLSVVSLRFIIYYHYLLNQKYDNIFICDSRDTFFQRNIFDEMRLYKNKNLYVFSESERVTIGECIYNTKWITTCYGQNALMDIRNELRSCAGTTLGTYKGIIHYLSLMKSHIISNPRCNDQGIHTYLVYCKLNTTSTARITHETGFVASIGQSDWVYRNKYGLVLNKNNQVYSVVHQFDRSGQLIEQTDLQYPILPDHILKLKD